MSVFQQALLNMVSLLLYSGPQHLLEYLLLVHFENLHQIACHLHSAKRGKLSVVGLIEG